MIQNSFNSVRGGRSNPSVTGGNCAPTNRLNSNGYFREIMRGCSRRLGYFREEKGIRVLGGILSKLVQDGFQIVFYVEAMFLQRV